MPGSEQCIVRAGTSTKHIWQPLVASKQDCRIASGITGGTSAGALTPARVGNLAVSCAPAVQAIVAAQNTAIPRATKQIRDVPPNQSIAILTIVTLSPHNTFAFLPVIGFMAA
jgi:hypothetical protein